MPRRNHKARAVGRRDVLRVGALTLGGLGLPDLLKADERREAAPAADAAIVVLLEGGPSHLETFDPKPDAPSDVRGDFAAIRTKTPGLQFCERLPRLAASSDRFAVLQGVSHTLSDHGLGREYVLTGARPLASQQHPDFPSVLAHERPSPAELPSAVSIPRSPHGPGFLGLAASPFETGVYPGAGRPIPLPALTLPSGADLATLERREELRRRLDRSFARNHQSSPTVAGMQKYYEASFDLLASPRTREAFDVRRESPAFARRFEPEPFAQSCLLAIRLVEAGVRCVTITMGGWDTHDDIFGRMGQSLLPRLDAGLSALFAGIAQRGLSDRTMVLVTGEFGRTPRLNDKPRPGRDHFSRCMSVLLAGGRVTGGQVVGASDETGSSPTGPKLTPEDIAATVYKNLGVNPKTVYQTPEGRPVTLVRDGAPIPGLS